MIELFEIIIPALLAVLMVSAVHVPLGIEVLRRGIIFIDLAIAQIAGLGLLITTQIFHLEGMVARSMGALLFALAASLFFSWIEKRYRAVQEAVIGVSFVLAASVSILVLANLPHGGDELKHLLSGQVLFVTYSQVLTNFPLLVGILAVWFWRPASRSGVAFYILFSLAITVAVQLVGVYVVFSTLILPALVVLGSGRPHLLGWSVSFVGVSLGIGCATWFDLPAGPVIVVALALVALVSRGLISLNHYPR